MSVHPKVATAAAAGAATTVLVFIVGQLGVHIPADVAAAITTLFTFAAGWLASGADGNG